MGLGTKGFTINYGTASGTYGSTLAKVQDVTGPSIRVGDVEITDPDGDWESYEPGFFNGGEVGFEMTFNKTEYAEVFSLIGEAKFFQILYRDGSELEFPGYINGVTPKGAWKGALTCDVSVKVSGEATFTAAA